MELAATDGLLLAWLALQGPTPRWRLAALLWPEKDADAARNSLRQRLFKLRRQVGVDLVQGQAVLELAALARHDLADSDTVLAGQEPGCAGEIDHWLQHERERRREGAEARLAERAQHAEDTGDWPTALALAREALALSSRSETAWRRLMRVHYLAGDRASALLAFDACERLLKDEVGAQPDAETLALLATIEREQVHRPPTAVGMPPPVAVLRPPRIVGRQAQWQALEQAWDSHAVALLVGDAGMGKSRLLGDFLAGRDRMLLLQARPGDERVVYGTLVRLLRRLPIAGLAAIPSAWRRELGRLLPELAEDADRSTEASRGESARARLAHALASTLDHDASPFDAYAVDDLHYADEASAELLRYVAQGSARRWLFAMRPAEGTEAARRLLGERSHDDVVVEIDLPPLTEPQVVELLVDLALPGWDPRQRALPLLKRSGGNPLYLLETIKAQWAGTDRGEVVPLGRPSVSALIERRMGQLSTQAVRLARCAAVAVPDFSIALAAHVLGVRTLDLADPWAELEMAQVFRDGAFAHDLIRDSALASIPGTIARQLHAEVAVYLDHHDGTPARIAEHWLAAAQPKRALPYLVAAADRARQTLRHREELALRDRAADLAEQVGERQVAFEQLMEGLQALLIVDRERLDDARFERMARLAGTAAQRVKVAVQHAGAVAERGPYELAIQLGEAAARQAREAGLPEDEVHALRFAAEAASHSGRSQKAVDLLRQALPWVMSHADEALKQTFANDYGACLSNADLPAESMVWTRRALEMALAKGDLAEAAAYSANLVGNHRFLGECQEALRTLGQARRFAMAVDAMRGNTWNLDLMEFALLRDLGRYGEALRLAEPARIAVEQHPPARHAYRLHQALLWLYIGQFARAHAGMAEMEQQGFGPQSRGRFLQIKARLAQAMGGSGAQWLREAMGCAADSGRQTIVMEIELDHADLLEPADGWRQCESVHQRADALGYQGIARSAKVALCRLAGQMGRSQQALLLAREIACFDDRYTVDDRFPVEAGLVAARVLAEQGERALAASLVTREMQWLTRVSLGLPEEFRPAFVERVPMHLELRAWAGRLNVGV